MQFTYIVHPVASQPVKALEYKQCSDDTDKADIEVMVECSQQNERLQHCIPAMLNQMLVKQRERGMGIRQWGEWNGDILLCFCSLGKQLSFHYRSQKLNQTSPMRLVSFHVFTVVLWYSLREHDLR